MKACLISGTPVYILIIISSTTVTVDNLPTDYSPLFMDLLGYVIREISSINPIIWRVLWSILTLADPVMGSPVIPTATDTSHLLLSSTINGANALASIIPNNIPSTTSSVFLYCPPTSLPISHSIITVTETLVVTTTQIFEIVITEYTQTYTSFLAGATSVINNVTTIFTGSPLLLSILQVCTLMLLATLLLL